MLIRRVVEIRKCLYIPLPKVLAKIVDMQKGDFVKYEPIGERQLLITRLRVEEWEKAKLRGDLTYLREPKYFPPIPQEELNYKRKPSEEQKREQSQQPLNQNAKHQEISK